MTVMEPTPPDPATLISWHPAFIEALQMELRAYRDVLDFRPEDPLTSGQLKIDCVVIKKAKNAVIRKNIAAIFREWNLLEYKSPEDYVSVDDFYKVYAYACLYISFKKVPVSGVTVTFVENHYPRALLEHLIKERGYKVAETGHCYRGHTSDTGNRQRQTPGGREFVAKKPERQAGSYGN